LGTKDDEEEMRSIILANSREWNGFWAWRDKRALSKGGVSYFTAKPLLWVMSGNARSEDIESAFHRKADIARRGWKVRSGPRADIVISDA
jgi:hypothetical protein